MICEYTKRKKGSGVPKRTLPALSLHFRPVVFADSKAVIFGRPYGANPPARPGEQRVLRSLRLKFPAETVGVYPRQVCSHALLVPSHGSVAADWRRTPQ